MPFSAFDINKFNVINKKNIKIKLIPKLYFKIFKKIKKFMRLWKNIKIYEIDFN